MVQEKHPYVHKINFFKGDGTKMPPQTCLQDNLMESFSQLRLPLSGWLICVKLTKLTSLVTIQDLDPVKKLSCLSISSTELNNMLWLYGLNVLLRLSVISQASRLHVTYEVTWSDVEVYTCDPSSQEVEVVYTQALASLDCRTRLCPVPSINKIPILVMSWMLSHE